MPLETANVVSMVPAISETLITFGLKSQLISISNISEIESLNPSIVLLDSSTISTQDLNILKAKYPVFVADIFNLESAIALIYKLGTLFNKTPEADYINHLINMGFKDILKLSSVYSCKNILLYTPNDILKTFNNEAFSKDLLRYLNVKNYIEKPHSSEQELQNVELIFTPKNTVPIFENVAMQPYQYSKIIEIEYAYFENYGSKLIDCVGYFHSLIKRIHEND